ncbi:MAG: cell division protein ZapA, partial [Roseovarius sp.]|nr:cell division protein ZapA [Roseovarius sp.]
MPDVDIEIGGRTFQVSCQEGEEHYLQAAAKMLDDEASVLTAQVGRIPETRMLLMAGLMLADKTAALEDDLKGLQAKIDAQERALRSAE